jgi:hypothetical protein
MPKGGIVLKVPKGTPAPAGYKFVRSLRTMNVYAKEQAAPVPQSEINSLINSFSKMQVQVQASAEDDLEAAMKKLTIGGKRKTRKNRSSRSRKSYRRRR